MLRALWKLLFPHYEAHYETVRYAFPLVVMTAFLAGLASIVSEGNSFVTISTSVSTVERDQQFFIDVDVTAHVPINAVDLTIAYPEDKMKILGIDTGTSVITLWAKEPYAKNGLIFLSGGTFRKGFIGEHRVARIRMQALEYGEARFLVTGTEFIAGDGSGTPVKSAPSKSTSEVSVHIEGEGDTIAGAATLSLITDTDGDGDVDLGDIASFMVAWLTRKNTFDFNGDGKMTFVDFSIILAESFFK